MKHLKFLCASTSMLLASAAMAGEKTADLLVTGSIAPGAACSTSIPAALSLGTIARGMLNPDPSKPTELETQRVRLTVACPQAMRFAFITREASSQASPDSAYPMYADESGKQMGRFYLRLDNASTKIDGATGYPTASDRKTGLEQATWGPSMPEAVTLPIPNNLFAVGFVDEPDSTKVPMNIKDLTTALLVTPQISPVDELDLSTTTEFSSNLGLEIVYF